MANCYNLNSVSQNGYFAQLLKSLYVGENSESFCAMQFLIYSSNLSNFENEITTLLHKIAKDDFNHANKIGGLIITLGGDLKNENLQNKYCFSKNINEIINNSIKIKENCLINYKIIRNKIQNSLIKKEIQIIIADEQKHYELLKKLSGLINKK